MKIMAAFSTVLLAALFLLYGLTSSSKLFDLGISVERNLAGLSVNTLTIDDGDITYLEGGQGDTLVLLHGFGANKDNWVRLSKNLVNNYHIIAIDLPGFGDSLKDGELDYGVNAQVLRLNELTTKLKLSTFHLAGNSMGGYIAGNYASVYPEKIKSLWLLDPLGVESAPNSEMFQSMLAGKRPAVLIKKKQEYKQLVSYVFHSPPFIPDFVISELGEKAEKDYPLHAKIFYDIHKISANKISFDSPLELSLKMFNKPVLIMWGNKDRVLHPLGAKILSSIIPDVKVVMMNDIGHLPMIEAPKDTAKQFTLFNELTLL